MAKKTGKSTRRTPRKGKGSQDASPPRERLPAQGQGIPIDDRIKAYVWALREEGESYRTIAKKAGISLKSVERIFASDVTRLAALVDAVKEERARVWERIESKSLRSLEAVIDEASEALLRKQGGARRKALNQTQKELLMLGRPWAAVFRQAADSATRRAEALNIRGTAREAESGSAQVAGEMTDEQLIEAAIEAGIVGMLPPALIPRARKLEEERREAGA